MSKRVTEPDVEVMPEPKEPVSPILLKGAQETIAEPVHWIKHAE